MGYTTQFDGRFKLNKPLTDDLYNKLLDFSNTRHCSENDYNSVAPGVPGLWCQWVPTSDKMRLEWDGVEKFYNYVEWLQYIIDNFLKPEGYEITEDSKVKYRGEEFNDIGYLVVKDNVVVKHKLW